MSINRDMEPYKLQKKNKIRTPSGAESWEWTDAGVIDAAVYKNSDMTTTASARYLESTHTGLTYCKQLQAGIYRLLGGGRIFQIASCDTKPRLTNLLLKEIDTNA